MPLIKSGSRAAVSRNISEMEQSGHPHNQAVAAALRNARKYAAGGFAAPMGEHSAQRQVFKEGFLHGAGPGRVDRLPITVGGGAYVVPADHLAAIGQGNSGAGANIMNKTLKMGPYGAAPTALRGSGVRSPHLNLRAGKFAQGGATHGVPIIAADGEFVIPPEKVAEIGDGDIDRGHKILDHWIISTRKKHIKTLRGLKPPKKD